MTPRLYFDYNATTPLAPSVHEVFCRAFKKDLKNSSSVHQEGREAKEELEKARSRIATHLGCEEEEVYFTGGATEGNNSVLFSAWESRLPGQTKIVTTEVEHDSVLKPLEVLKKKGGEIKLVKVNARGETDLDEWHLAIDEATCLVSCMLANNETGMVFPVKELAALAHRKGCLFHTDAACGVGKIPLLFREVGADFLTFSSCKFYGPKGVGGMLIRKGVPFVPLMGGGAHEREKRPGTVNVVGVLGMATALEFALDGLEVENRRQWDLRERIKKGLLSIKPNVRFHESSIHQLPGTLNVVFPGESGQTLLARLDLEGVAASFGAACQSGSLEVSRVILAMGVGEEEAASSIRLSFGRMTTEGEVEGLLAIFEEIFHH